LAVFAHEGCVSGCANRASNIADVGFDITQRVSLDFPATYTGVLPCADCNGIRYTLNLWSDQVFFRRLTYLGKGAGVGVSFDDVGQWSFSPDGTTLLLTCKDETPDLFAIEGRERLRKLDLDGQPIVSNLDYTLDRQEKVIWFEPSVRMHGMFHLNGNGGVFVECLSRLRLDVVDGTDYPALERSYSFARNENGEAILVSVEGRIVDRARTDGRGYEQVFVVDKFLNLWAGESCWPEARAKVSSCGR
jgi:copper homeostasis protein (lipoprotein)